MILSRRIPLGGLMALLFSTVPPAQAEIDLGSVDMLASDSPTSPAPQGLVMGQPCSGPGPLRRAGQRHLRHPRLYLLRRRLHVSGRSGRYYFHKDEKVALYGALLLKSEAG